MRIPNRLNEMTNMVVLLLGLTVVGWPPAMALGQDERPRIRQARAPAGIGWGTADRWTARDLEAETLSPDQTGRAQKGRAQKDRGRASRCERRQVPDGSDGDRDDPVAVRLPVGAGLSAADHVGTGK